LNAIALIESEYLFPSDSSGKMNRSSGCALFISLAREAAFRTRFSIASILFSIPGYIFSYVSRIHVPMTTFLGNNAGATNISLRLDFSVFYQYDTRWALFQKWHETPG